MPSVSKNQQRLFGMALSVKRGELSRSEVSSDVLDIVDSMSEKKIRDFAKTSHEGLPKRVKEYSFIGDKHTKNDNSDNFPHGKLYRTDESLTMKVSNPSTISALSSLLPPLHGMEQSKRKEIVRDLIKTMNQFYDKHNLDVKIA